MSWLQTNNKRASSLRFAKRGRGGELVEMKHIKQLQLYLKEGFTVVDDAFVKEIRNADDIVTGFEIIVNETKLSKFAPPTTRQTQFIAEKAGELIVRSTKPDAIKIFNKKGVKVTIKKYVKAVGDGTENIPNSNPYLIFFIVHK